LSNLLLDNAEIFDKNIVLHKADILSKYFKKGNNLWQIKLIKIEAAA